ncbi:MAG TPA: succinyl-diaminopimelate desuccinylase [Candidatus Agrococcus pullicola]|uniref:Succinyl-diaminopimelate desuccinylase n=1 Tax=Candidatus Agrococcus pullicola TaxID=2838429 RepID=A0A9D1YSM2_9MICO|nr:succinyl-diaminopimelate desuccinylase [Candidatus Agrococcus pullicola]
MLQNSLDLTQDAVDITRQICDINSVSGNETALADAIEAAVRAVDHLEVDRHGDTVVARTNLGRARRVVIAGHIDTVPLNDNLPTRFETRGSGEVLWGRGTVDMKAGVAVQLKLAVEIAAPSLDVTWIWYDHEEVSADLNGLRNLAEARPDLMQGDFAILGEPSNGAVEGGCNGTLRVDVVTRGVRAHSARSWVGHNAIHDAAAVLQILQDYRPSDVNVEGLVFREGLNAVGISGGIAGNVIPDECRITINYRFAPSKSVEQAIAHVKDLFAGFEVIVTDQAGGASPGLDAVVAREFLEATGLSPKAKYGWTDVARFWSLGIPAVNYGPGDPLLAHHDDEHVPLEQIRDAELRLRNWLTAS